MASVELSARDWAVLDRLKEMGDSLDQPRHTLLFFYKKASGEAPDFDRVATLAPGRQLKDAGRDADGLTLEGHLRVDPLSIASLLEWAENLAEEADAVFDGWECAVMAPKQ